MKEQELHNLIEKSVGKKGPLKIPSFWMREIFLGLIEWCKTLTPKVDVPTKVSQLKNDKNYVIKSYVDEIARNKQDVLISGENIKTIGNESLLSNGNIDISYLTAIGEVIRRGGVLIGLDSSRSIKYVDFEIAEQTYIITDNSKQWTGCACDSIRIPSLEDTDYKVVIAMDFSNMKSLPSMNQLCTGTNIERIDLSMVDTSTVTDMSYAFYKCASLKKAHLSNNNLSNVTNIRSAFGYTKIDILDLSMNNLSNVDDATYAFRDAKIDTLRLPKMSPSAMSKIFSSCQVRVLDLSQFDTTNVNDCYGYLPWPSFTNLETLIMGPNYFKRESLTNIDISGAKKWIDDSVRLSLVENSYDRTGNGLNTAKLKLSSETKAVLSEEDLAIIAAKGYVIQ